MDEINCEKRTGTANEVKPVALYFSHSVFFLPSVLILFALVKA